MGIMRPDRDDRREQDRKRQRDAAIHQSQAAVQQHTDEPSTDLVRELTDDQLTGPDTLRNIASKDFPLANLSEAETHELRWLFRVEHLMQKAMHPPPRSHLTGQWRAWLFDDADQALEPLSGAERVRDDSYRLGSEARLTLGREATQQEMLRKSVSESRVKDDSDDDSGWFF